MRISFSPQRREGALTLVRSGDTLVVNGDAVDLSVVPDGATLPAEAIDNAWIVGKVERIDGVLHVAVLLPHAANPPQAVALPEPIAVTEDGPIEVPQDEETGHGDD